MSGETIGRKKRANGFHIVEDQIIHNSSASEAQATTPSRPTKLIILLVSAIILFDLSDFPDVFWKRVNALTRTAIRL